MKPVFLIAAILFALGMPAQDTETKVKMKDLPPAVQKTVTEQSQGAKLVGLSKEIENGRTLYEAELKVNGHGKDVSIDESGKVVSVEEETPLSAIPPAAQAAIQKELAGAKMIKLEIVKGEGPVFYEAAYKKGGKNVEVKVTPGGEKLK